jgi:hypothetical protein
MKAINTAPTGMLLVTAVLDGALACAAVGAAALAGDYLNALVLGVRVLGN